MATTANRAHTLERATLSHPHTLTQPAVTKDAVVAKLQARAEGEDKTKKQGKGKKATADELWKKATRTPSALAAAH